VGYGKVTIKTFVMITRRSDLPQQEFHDHWRYPHAVWGSRMTTLHGYVQSHQFHCDRLDESQGTFDGVAEAWFRSVEAAAAFRDEPVLTQYLKPDEPKFIDVDRLQFVVTEEEVLDEPKGAGDPADPATIWSPWRAPTSVKLIQFIAPDGNSRWAGDDDISLGRSVGALRHVRCRPPASVYGQDPPQRGVRELQWPTLSEFQAGIARSPDAFSELIGRAGRGITIAASAELFIVPS
jgi:hypothetical protein